MATILRTWSYQYQWLYDGISRIAAISVGGEEQFRQLPWQGLTVGKETKVLDLCCGSGQATQFLVKLSHDVTGLDVSPVSLQRAQRNVPQANYVEALAQEIPFPDSQFDLVHTSVALHEMKPSELKRIVEEVYRVLKPEGIWTLVDFHKPTNFLFWPGLALFMWLFETETAWQLLATDLVGLLEQTGFEIDKHNLRAGGSLQVIQAKK
ncbi:methyltransferase domain-containing protein [Lyngbya aestuarii]|uniref:methyltransferase domain-containing protein n=1 Tax=Lyngbya aestuarii TaxID=118322 RepID=UPI00403DCFBA